MSKSHSMHKRSHCAARKHVSRDNSTPWHLRRHVHHTLSRMDCASYRPLPTSGLVAAGPGTPWLPIDPTLAYVNEPSLGGRGCNACIEDGPTMRDIHFVAAVDIALGEEIFIDYGSSYDRSSYNSGA